MRAAEEGYEADKKLRYVVAAQERAYEEELIKQKNEAKRKAAEAAEAEKNKKNEEEMLNDFLSSLPAEERKVEGPTEEKRDVEAQSTVEVEVEDAPVAPEVPEEALLEGFFSELNEAAKEKEKKKEADDNAKQTELLNEKYTKQDLGTPLEQFHRLTCPHYEFKNQNPYYVLQLDIDASMEDIKYRSPPPLPPSFSPLFFSHSLDIVSYQPKSTRTNCVMLRIPDLPSKRCDPPLDLYSSIIVQLKDAYQKLCDEGQRNTIIMNIEHVRSEVMKERRKLINKGVCFSLPILFYLCD